MSRRVPSWLQLVVVVALILQGLLPVLSAIAPPIALAAEDAPPPAGEHAMPPIFLPLILSATPRAPESVTAAPPVGESAPATPLNLDLDLSLSLTAAPAWVEPGDVVTFTVTASNALAEPLPAVTLTAPLASGFVYVAQSAQGFAYEPSRQTLTWAAGELMVGAVITGSFQARVQGLAIGETLTQTVTAASPALPEPLTTSALIDVVPPAADVLCAKPGQTHWLRTTDGRVLLRIPPGAVRRETCFAYMARPDLAASLPDNLQTPFDLNARDDQGQPVREFPEPLGLTFALTPAERRKGVAPAASLFYRDDASGRWEILPTQVERGRGQLRTQLPHLTTLAQGSTVVPEPAPGIKGVQSQLFSGAVTVDYPINLPPGPGGLAPALALSYSSRSLAGAGHHQLAGWGWDFSGVSYVLRDPNTGKHRAARQPDLAARGCVGAAGNGCGCTQHSRPEPGILRV